MTLCSTPIFVLKFEAALYQQEYGLRLELAAGEVGSFFAEG